MGRAGARRAVLPELILGLLVVLSPATVRADVPFVGVNAGAPISGDSILFTNDLAADIASSGCRFVRINFIQGFGEWDAARLSRYDEIIQNAVNNDLEVLAIFSNETQAGSQAEWNENYDSTGMNPYIEAYAETAFLLINRYKDDVKLYEIWNEPSCWSVEPSTNPLSPGCTYLWPRIFANMLAETYTECIAQGGPTFFTDHNISLVSGAPFAHDIGGSFTTGADYLSDTYSQGDIWDAFETDPDNPTGRRYPWDLLGYHFYLNQDRAVSTGELNAYFSTVRGVRDSQGDGADFLVTEFGWTSQGVGDDGKASNLTDSYDWMRTQDDIAGALWYQYNCCDPNGDWGLTRGIGVYQEAWYAFADQCGVLVPPIARFSAAPLTGVAPLAVSFAETSSGLIDTYAWDFGDGTGSTDSDPQHVYEEAGTYTVSLAVTGPGGSDVETKADYIVVDPAPLLADLDGDGDVDLADAQIFGGCYTGAGVTAIPAGCETDVVTAVPMVQTHETAGSLGGLSASIVGDDLLAGDIGSVEAGGFYPSLSPPADASDLTDGVAGAGTEAVLADYLRPSLRISYVLSPPQSIAGLNVFAQNSDGRVFQNYDVEYSVAGDSSYQMLIEGVTSGPFGQINPGSIGASLTQVAGVSEGPIAVEVDALRFTFYCVSNVSGFFWDEWDAGEPGDTDGNPRAYVASLIKEIDVLEYSGTTLANVADLDGDGDVDLDDWVLFDADITGPWG
jgi:PKD repeat protein